MEYGKKYVERMNFILVTDHNSSKGIFGPIVVRTSGHTTTMRALKSSWVKNQIETIPSSDRYHLSDPLIRKPKVQKPYLLMDCNVMTLYLKPECRGLSYAMKEFAEYFEELCNKRFFKYTALIGNSKGGVFVAGVTKYLKNPTNILIITPAFGTIVGDEKQVLEQLDNYKANKETLNKILLTPEIALYKTITHVFGSRRRTDKDLAKNSKFLLEELDLSNLPKHNAMLVTATCPENPSNISEILYKHYGKYIGLDKEGDGIVRLKEQCIPEKLVKKVINIKATHQTALSKANAEIYYFLYDAKTSKAF